MTAPRPDGERKGGMKRALVTGGSGALGASIAKALGTAGMHVIVHSMRNAERAAAVVAAIAQQGGSAEQVEFDVTDHAACAKAAAA